MNGIRLWRQDEENINLAALFFRIALEYQNAVLGFGPVVFDVISPPEPDITTGSDIDNACQPALLVNVL